MLQKRHEDTNFFENSHNMEFFYASKAPYSRSSVTCRAAA